MAETVNICFVGRLSFRFVKKDYEILRKYYDIDLIDPPSKKTEWPKYIHSVKTKVKNCDLTFSWFAVNYSAPVVYYSKRYNKKSIVIVGGYDAAYVPEINYGVFTDLRKIPTKYIYKNVDKALVVDSSLKEDIIKNAKVSGRNIEYLPTGYDPNYWKPKGEKENIVLTVGSVNHTVVKRKGFETFVRAAKYIPDARFVLVGKHQDESIENLKKISPPNVEFTGFIPDKELLEMYQKAKVYCQLSRYEGLPNALCEAMLCGCTPVGTKYCGIPTAIGDTGFYVPYGNAKETADGIKKALNKADELAKHARKRIMKLFPHELRERELIKIIEKL